MAVIENSVWIDRSPEDVFDYLVDMRNELEWNPDAQSMEKITEGPIGVGTKFLGKWKQSGLIEAECTKFDRPHGWTYLNGGPVTVILDIKITARDGGSLLESRFDAHPNGLFKLIFPVFVQAMKRAEKRTMLYIKQALEKH